MKEEALGDTGGMESLFQEAGENEALLTNEQALQQANLSVVRNIPPHDISANTPAGAYPLEQLIPAEEWENLDVRELKAAAKKVKDEEILRQQKYPNFVLSRLRRIRVEVSSYIAIFFSGSLPCLINLGHTDLLLSPQVQIY